METYRNPNASVEERIRDLIQRMTLEEKVGQLIQKTIGKDANPNNIGPQNSFDPMIGSVLAFMSGAKKRNEYQKAAMTKTRLGIPIIWGMDVIHGWKTIFPVSLAQAGSFNPELTRRLSRVAAQEAYYGGIDWTFSPMVDVPHDPRWGRVVEGYGEDPYTSGRFAEAAVRGYQGEDLTKPGNIAACLKHFVGYSASEGGRDYSYTDISRRALWEWYLPSFQAGVKAGVRTVMSSFNDITGIPAVANHYTLTEILRDKWGFTGFVVSDWCGVRQLGNQGFSENPEKQTVACLTAGNDMDMLDGIYYNIPKLVAEGKLSIRNVDLAVERILRVKLECGLFEHPYTEEKEESQVHLLPEYKQLAVEAAREAMVLLKNKNKLLPLNREIRSLALIGPAAADSAVHLGTWLAAAPADSTSAPSILAEISTFFPHTKIHYAQGCAWNDKETSGFADAVHAAEQADAVILALGEEGGMSGEDRSRAEIRLPGMQEELAKTIARTGKPVVLLVCSGRPIAYPALESCADAILHLWQSGYGAAQACLEILTGAVNPSGKLPMTFPRCSSHIPLYYNSHRKARPRSGQYGDMPDQTPFYEFGYGLSYTEFSYENLKIDGLHASFTLTNTGSCKGKETVLWYLSDPEATLTQPEKRIIAFEKFELVPGESKIIHLKLDPMRDLSYPNENGDRILEPGRFLLSAGGKVQAELIYG